MTDPTSTILIVDDSGNDLDLLVESLRPLGSTLVTIKDPHEVLTSVRGLKPIVVLLDALLPGLSGFDLCQQIKSDPELKETRVIIITGVYLKQQYRQEALHQFRADGFVTKPFRPIELQRMVARFRSGETIEPAPRLTRGFRLAKSRRRTRWGFLERLLGRSSRSGETESDPPGARTSVSRRETRREPSKREEGASQGGEAASDKASTEGASPEDGIPQGTEVGQASDTPAPEEGARSEEPGYEEHRQTSAGPSPETGDGVPRLAGEGQAGAEYQIFSKDELEALLESHQTGSPGESTQPPTEITQAAAPDVGAGTLPESTETGKESADERSATRHAVEEERRPQGASSKAMETLPFGVTEEGSNGEERTAQPGEESTSPSSGEASRAEAPTPESEPVEPPSTDEAESGGEAPAEPPESPSTYTAHLRDVVREATPSVAARAGRLPDDMVAELERGEFHREAQRELSKCKRVYKPLTIILVEIEDLPQIVELLGREVREPVLRHVALQARASLREADLVGVLISSDRIAAAAFACDRYGGDRFVARLRRTLDKNPFRVGESLPPIIPRLRFGMATFPQDGQEVAPLLEKAEGDLAGVN